MSSTPISKSVTVTALTGDPRLDALVRGIGHVLLMKVDPEAAKALNLTGFVAGQGTRANSNSHPAAPLAAGGECHG